MLGDQVRIAAFRSALAKVIRPGQTTVADLGAGTGILAFLARELGAREVWLYDPGPVLGLAEHDRASATASTALHFVPERSLDVAEPPRVDVVVAEVLGNFAYEEDVLETLRDARRFLAPRGTMIPHSIVQWAAPVSADRFERDFRAWRGVGARSIGPTPSGSRATTCTCSRSSRRTCSMSPRCIVGRARVRRRRSTAAAPAAQRGRSQRARPIFGFALWWECTLVPGVVLSTSPFGPRTHWDQIYLPLLEPLTVRAGDALALEISSETGGGESGIDVRWTVEQRRGEKIVSRQSLDIASGFLG